ncbi:MAG: ABC transporter permease [Actinobacteria bacterium]|nr:ABC transporter permease [Actinomycetota bacterium]
MASAPSHGSRASHRGALAAGRTLARWLVGPLVTVLVASFVISAALALAPGDPVAQLLGPRPTAAQIAVTRHELGLDRSVPVRYWDWLSGAVHGDLGFSIVHRDSVATLIGPRLGTTALLVAYAGVLILVGGVGLGILGGALRRMSPLVAAITGLGIAIPAFVAAQLLVSVFSLRLGWFPATGAGSGLADRLWHLTLPAIALAVAWAAYVAQITRTAIRDEDEREHVETARARGLTAPVVFRRHVLRNAAIPIVTISGLSIAGLIASSVVVESAFGLGGLGTLLVDSVTARDYNVVQAITVALVLVFVVVTTLIDVLHTMLDPRLRRGAERA